MTESHTQVAARSPRAGLFVRRLLVALATVVVVLSGAFGWLLASESGLRALCAGLERLSGGQLVIDQPGGRLLDEWSAGTLRWQDAGQTVTVEQLVVQWSPGELWQRRLSVERLAAASLAIASAPSEAPAVLPDQIALPMAVTIGQVELGRLLYGDLPASDKPPQLLAENIAGSVSSDGRTHRVEHLRAMLGKLKVNADATLGGARPFALTLNAGVTGAALGQSFLLNVQGYGSLEELQIEGQAESIRETEASSLSTASEAAFGKTITGTLSATITPFATHPLAALRAQLKGVDPAVFAAGAPAALLDIDAVLDGAASAAAASPAVGETALAGRVDITNRRSGSVDRQLLPVQNLQATLDWIGDRLTLSGLTLGLTGGGHLAGKGSFANGQLELDLAASGLDAHALHASLLPTRLAGPLKVSLGNDQQALALDLRDARYAVKGRVSLAADIVELSELVLTYEKAGLKADGKLELNGEGRFALRGQLQNVEPARFLKDQAGALGGLPGTRISADFDAQGVLRPGARPGAVPATTLAPQIGLHFDLKDSRINSQKLAGQGDVDLLGGLLRKAEINLDVAGNRFVTRGAFGSPGDRLSLKVDAPKLEALGLSNVFGDAQADLTLGGSMAQPDFSGELTVKRLKIATLLDLRGASLNAQLGAGNDGVMTGTFRCVACASPSAGVPPLAIKLQAEGLRSRHRLNVRVDLPDDQAEKSAEKWQLRLALEGGLVDGAASRPAGKKRVNSSAGREDDSLNWRGTLGELWLGNVGRVGKGANESALIELKAPSPLQVGSEMLAFGPATLSGAVGDLRIERLGRAGGGWQSAGGWKNIRPPAILAAFPALASWRELLGPQSLSLAADWDLALGEQASGRAAIWREAGDLSFASLSLGLAELRLQTTLASGRFAANLEVHGTRLGDISAQAETRLDSTLNAESPLQGKLQARMPDLAWLTPLLGDAWQLAGQIDGQMLLSGSLARPQFSGAWRGEKLAVRALDQGMRLERGEAQLDITPEKLLLRRLVFDSDLQPLPRILQLDSNINSAQLTGKPGRFEASGELALGASAGMEAGAAKLRLHLDRVGVMQRPDQWVAVSGNGELRIGEASLVASGKLGVDAGFWRLAETGRPSLSDDVVILRSQEKKTAGPARRALRLDLLASLGSSFHFRGAGVESRLTGDVRIRSDDAGLPRASGTIRTAEGRFDAYGQKLDIQRGIINFQGAIDNPGLNILAVRPNLQVEAGVEVSGTAQRPVIRLVSSPNVPDTEKLSWLVLGRSPEQQEGNDSSLLFAAAQTIFGGQGDGFLGQLQQGLGIDEFGVNSGQVGSSGRQATSQVATTGGFGQSQTVSGQVVSIGKRLSSNAMLSYEQSLSTTESIVKLTVDINRQLSVVGRAGSDSAVDVFWHYRFGK